MNNKTKLFVAGIVCFFAVTGLIFSVIGMFNIMKGNDKIVVLDGTIEEMRIDGGFQRDYIIVVESKEYCLSDLIIMNTNRSDKNLYYDLNLGDNITIFASRRVQINGVDWKE